MVENTVIVTGAAGGLGSALALVCAREGWNTVMLDSNLKGLERAYDRITQSGLPEPILHPMDLSTANPEQFDGMLETIEAEFGGLDAVVHCAARFEGLIPLEHVTPPEWLQHMQVNLNAAWLLSVQSLPLLKTSRAGRLYFMLEDLPKMQGAFWGPYGVSKHALRVLVSQFAAEYQSTSIQVLGIDPGPMKSDLRSRAYHGESPSLQPEPDVVAERIMDYLSGKIQPSGEFLDLSQE